MFRSLLIALSLLLLAMGGSGCSGSRIHQARAVLYEADSLRAAGVPYNDSLLLGEAVDAFASCRYLFPTDYARASYFYGRCLRAAGHQSMAMQSFINATHAYDFPASLFTRQPDHTILGRVYSNMANMCRMAEEYDLAYHVYEHSADAFARASDSLAYAYALTNMAWDKVVLAEKEVALCLVDSAMRYCPSPAVHTKAMEIRAATCMFDRQYHSVLTYTACDEATPFMRMLRAQAYSYLGIGDSATYYARQLVQQTNDLYYLNDLYYILTHDDTFASKEDIRSISSLRSDLQKSIELQHAELMLAVQLLVQDKKQHFPMKWVLSGILLLLLIVGVLVGFSLRLYRHRVDFQREQARRIAIVEDTCRLLCEADDLRQALSWSDYDVMCGVVNHHFGLLAERLKQDYLLSERDIQLCVLVLLDLSRSRMAEMLFCSQNSIGKLKERTAAKLGTNAARLRVKLVELATL